MFVCQANTGRSQMAAGLFKKYSKSGNADSAGTKVDPMGKTVGEKLKLIPNVQHAVDAMSEEGIDILSNERTQITQSILDKYDKIIVMAEKDTIPDWLSSSPKFEYWHIKDPLGKDLESTRTTRDEIKRKVLELIKSQK